VALPSRDEDYDVAPVRSPETNRLHLSTAEPHPFVTAELYPRYPSLTTPQPRPPSTYSYEPPPALASAVPHLQLPARILHATPAHACAIAPVQMRNTAIVAAPKLRRYIISRNQITKSG
jgi:hypothetical protein